MISILSRTIFIYILLLLIMRLLGKRQLGELELSELVFSIMLSELAVAPILDSHIPLYYTLIPIAALVALEILFTFLETKNCFFKKLLSDDPSILINRGKIDRKQLANVRMTVEELLSQLRLNNVSDINTVYYAILEKNGQLSVFPRSEPENGIMRPLVIDGNIVIANLTESGHTEAWLLKQLEKLGCPLCETFVFAADDADNVYFSKKE